MTQENLQAQELQQALSEWIIQWTNEFIESHIIPNVKKALENEFVCYCLINWKKENDRYVREKKSNFLKSIETGRNELTSPIIDDRSRFSANIYDFFAKVCK